MKDNSSKLAQELISVIEGLFTEQDHHRAMHARGIEIEGKFYPHEKAHLVSKAPHLQNTDVPVTVRFSSFGSIPRVPGTEGLNNLQGMSIKFFLPDGSETDIVTHSYNGYPAANSQEFKDFMIALAAHHSKAANQQMSLLNYLQDHPVAKTFLESQLPPPVSYATINYFGVNTFKFINEANTITFGRYQVKAVDGEQFLLENTEKVDLNYLFNEIKERVTREKPSFKLLLEIAEPEDKLDDPSIAWPTTRTKLELGTIQLLRVIPDNQVTEEKRYFIPGRLPPGIEVQDPMINVRTEVYEIFHQHRMARNKN